MAATVLTTLATAVRQPALLHPQLGICALLASRVLTQNSTSLALNGVRHFSYHRPTADIQHELQMNSKSQTHLLARELFVSRLEVDVSGGFFDALKDVKRSIRDEKSTIQKEQTFLFEKGRSLMEELKKAHGGDISAIFQQSSKSLPESAAPSTSEKTAEAEGPGIDLWKRKPDTVNPQKIATPCMALKQEPVTPTLASLEQDLTIKEAQIAQVDQEVRDISSLDSIPGSHEQSAAQKEQYRLAYEKKSKLIQEKWSIQERIQVMKVKNGTYQEQSQDPTSEEAKAKEEETKAKNEANEATAGVFWLVAVFCWLGFLTMGGFWDWLFDKCHSFWSALKRWVLFR